MEIQEKAWVNQIPGTKVQDDDFICVICLEPMNEVNSSAIAKCLVMGDTGVCSSGVHRRGAHL